MDTEALINIIILACGVYMIYSAFSMKTTGKIPTNLLGKGVNLATAKDIPGFIKKMYPITMVVGILTFLCGLSGGLGILKDVGYVQTIISLVFVVIILGYGKILVDAQKKYLMNL